MLANLFIDFHGKNMVRSVSALWFLTLLSKDNVNELIYFFNFEQDADKVFEFLNSQYTNIKFTFEKLKDDKSVFLDVLPLTKPFFLVFTEKWL